MSPDFPPPPGRRHVRHLCHWPGCTVPVPPRFWGCSRHWSRLPKRIREEIDRTFRPGQELTKDPIREYVAAAKAAHDWAVLANERAAYREAVKGSLLFPDEEGGLGDPNG